MHEFSLAENILACAQELSREHGNAPITRIEVEIGALQAVVPDSLKFAFEAVVTGTIADGAVLDWHEVPARVACRACSHEYAPDDFIWICPECGAPGGHAVQGDELNITRVVLSDAALQPEVPSGS